jgi:hypothetical protein
VPGAAVPAFTFSVALPPALKAAGVTDTLVPLGAPETDRLTAPALPTTAVEMVLDPLVPCTRLRLLELAEIVKSGGAATVSVSVVEWVAAPSVPVTVSV